MSISVIVLAFNEERSIDTVAREIVTILQVLGHPCELIIVDDGSTDDTGRIADNLAQEFTEIRTIHHKFNMGLGGGYSTGFANAKFDFVTFFPADGQYPAVIIQQFYPYMTDADMVLGYLPQRRRTFVPELLSFMERILYRIALGSLPRFQGIVMFRRDLLDSVELRSTGRGWAIMMEFIVRVTRAKNDVISVPIEIRPRLSGASKVNNWRTIWANFKQVLALRRYL